MGRQGVDVIDAGDPRIAFHGELGALGFLEELEEAV